MVVLWENLRYKLSINNEYVHYDLSKSQRFLQAFPLKILQNLKWKKWEFSTIWQLSIMILRGFEDLIVWPWIGCIKGDPFQHTLKETSRKSKRKPSSWLRHDGISLYTFQEQMNTRQIKEVKSKSSIRAVKHCTNSECMCLKFYLYYSEGYAVGVQRWQGTRKYHLC